MKFSSLFAIASLPLLVFSLSVTTTNTLHALAKRDFVSTILADLESAVTCASCNALLIVLKLLADFGDAAFVGVITSVCQDFTSEGDIVCAGAIALEGPILAQDLRGIDVFTRSSQLMCLTIFGLCDWPAVQPYTVEMSPKPATSRPPPSRKTPIQVVHISDIHVDLEYEIGASYNCTMDICCRPYTGADAPNATLYPAEAYGNIHCDSPVSLEESMYAAIESLVPNRAFTIFTGDVIDGAVWAVNDTYVANGLNDAFGRMQGIGRTYAAVGNHDSSPVNSFPPELIQNPISSQWAYNNMSADWGNWIGSAAAAEVQNNHGCYSTIDPTGVRIISLNTNFWYKANFWMYEQTMESDPSGIFAWMVSELEAAEAAGQRVWIIGHMPNGGVDTFHDASNYFNQIIQRFDATIAGLFYGHTHQDQFEIAYSNYTDQSADTATMVSYIAPALTPTSGNPSFRVYSVDPVTFAVLDYSTYYTNISSPTYHSGPTWEFLYSVKDTYGPLLTPPLTDPAAELTPAFWHNLTVLYENDDAIFQNYWTRKMRDFNTSATCDGACKAAEICQLRAGEAQYNCANVSIGFNFRRDEDSGSTTSVGSHSLSACHGSAILPTMQLIGNGGIQALRDSLVKVMGADWLNTPVDTSALHARRHEEF